MRMRAVAGRWRLAAVVSAALCVVAALLKFYPLLKDFDTVSVRLEFAAVADSPGARLDDVLLASLTHFGYIRGFDHVFAAGGRSASLHRPVWLDRCEVRQADYQRFAQWLLFHPETAVAAPGQPARWRHTSDTSDHAVSGRLDAPANGLTWYDAWAYCRAAGGRLPRADEWIAAAAGGGQRLYPWGDAFAPSAWPYLDPLLNAARKCGEHPETDTPEGLADMGHGVSEWTVGDGTPPASLVMGGNGYNAPRELYSVAILHRHAPPAYRSPYLGFRCAYDAPPVPAAWRPAAGAEPDAVVVPAGGYAVGIPDGARVPSLLAVLPRDRLDLIERIFTRADRPDVVDLHLTAREITRRQYDAFLNDPFVLAGFHAEANQPRHHSHRPRDWDAQMNEPDLPAVNVDWWSAYAFASWAGGRLPTAQEWESAASGQGRRLYPWGNAYAEVDAGGPGEGGDRRPRAVRAGDPDATPEGLLAMGGNVSEWTRSVSSASGRFAVVVKGGNFLLPGAQAARMDFRNHLSPNHASPTLGFRVAFDRPR